MAEFEVVGLNLENTRRQVVELQRENQLLRLETASLKQNEPVVDSRKIAELEDDLLDLQTKLEEEQAKRKKDLKDRDRELETMRKKLQELENVENSLEELRRMKAAEYSDLYDPVQNQSLEALLQMKNKKLETDLVHSRIGLGEIQKQVKVLETELTSVNEKNSELQKLITRYEESTTIAAISPPTNDSGMSLASSIGQDSTVIAVLTNQRDRLKKYSEDLETVLSISSCTDLELEKL